MFGKILFEHEAIDNSVKKTLIEAVSTGAYLSDAYLRGANLSDAYLRGADLRGAYLRGANLSDAYLRGAYLRGADLRGADLSGADLRGAYFRGAYLKKIEPLFRIVPEEGSFIAWKKCVGEHLVKIEIPSEAKRHNYLGGRKCRAEFVKVLDIRNSKGHKVKKCHGKHDLKTIYEIGKIVRPDSYDPDPLTECSNGIHFFLTKQEAKDW